MDEEYKEQLENEEKRKEPQKGLQHTLTDSKTEDTNHSENKNNEETIEDNTTSAEALNNKITDIVSEYLYASDKTQKIKNERIRNETQKIVEPTVKEANEYIEQATWLIKEAKDTGDDSSLKEAQENIEKAAAAAQKAIVAANTEDNINAIALEGIKAAAEAAKNAKVAKDAIANSQSHSLDIKKGAAETANRAADNAIKAAQNAQAATTIEKARKYTDEAKKYAAEAKEQASAEEIIGELVKKAISTATEADKNAKAADAKFEGDRFSIVKKGAADAAKKATDNAVKAAQNIQTATTIEKAREYAVSVEKYAAETKEQANAEEIINRLGAEALDIANEAKKIANQAADMAKGLQYKKKSAQSFAANAASFAKTSSVAAIAVGNETTIEYARISKGNAEQARKQTNQCFQNVQKEKEKDDIIKRIKSESAHKLQSANSFELNVAEAVNIAKQKNNDAQQALTKAQKIADNNIKSKTAQEALSKAQKKADITAKAVKNAEEAHKKIKKQQKDIREALEKITKTTTLTNAKKQFITIQASIQNAEKASASAEEESNAEAKIAELANGARIEADKAETLVQHAKILEEKIKNHRNIAAAAKVSFQVKNVEEAAQQALECYHSAKDAATVEEAHKYVNLAANRTNKARMVYMEISDNYQHHNSFFKYQKRNQETEGQTLPQKAGEILDALLESPLHLIIENVSTMDLSFSNKRSDYKSEEDTKGEVNKQIKDKTKSSAKVLFNQLKENEKTKSIAEMLETISNFYTTGTQLTQTAFTTYDAYHDLKKIEKESIYQREIEPYQAEFKAQKKKLAKLIIELGKSAKDIKDAASGEDDDESEEDEDEDNPTLQEMIEEGLSENIKNFFTPKVLKEIWTGIEKFYTGVIGVYDIIDEVEESVKNTVKDKLQPGIDLGKDGRNVYKNKKLSSSITKQKQRVLKKISALEDSLNSDTAQEKSKRLVLYKTPRFGSNKYELQIENINILDPDDLKASKSPKAVRSPQSLTQYIEDANQRILGEEKRMDAKNENDQKRRGNLKTKRKIISCLKEYSFAKELASADGKRVRQSVLDIIFKDMPAVVSGMAGIIPGNPLENVGSIVDFIPEVYTVVHNTCSTVQLFARNKTSIGLFDHSKSEWMKYNRRVHNAEYMMERLKKMGHKEKRLVDNLKDKSEAKNINTDDIIKSAVSNHGKAKDVFESLEQKDKNYLKKREYMEKDILSLSGNTYLQLTQTSDEDKMKKIIISGFYQDPDKNIQGD